MKKRNCDYKVAEYLNESLFVSRFPKVGGVSIELNKRKNVTVSFRELDFALLGEKFNTLLLNFTMSLRSTSFDFETI